MASRLAQGAAVAHADVLRPELPEAMQRAGMDKQSALYRAVVRIQSRYRGYVIRKVRQGRSPALAGQSTGLVCRVGRDT